jgi:biotin carboxyl carrier protein
MKRDLATITDLLQVETAHTSAQKNYLNALFDYRLSYAALELATGELAPDSPAVTQFCRERAYWRKSIVDSPRIPTKCQCCYSPGAERTKCPCMERNLLPAPHRHAFADIFTACSSNENTSGRPGPVVSGVQTEIVHLESAPSFTRQSAPSTPPHRHPGSATGRHGARDPRASRRPRQARPILAVLDDRSAQAQVQGAEAGVNEAIQGGAEVDQALKAATADRQFAEATLNRYKALLAKNSLSRQEFDGAEARYQSALANERSMEAKTQQIKARQQQARSQEDSAQTYLSYSRIVSPLDGIVTAKSVDAGTVVMPGTPVLTVEDTHDIVWKQAFRRSMSPMPKPAIASPSRPSMANSKGASPRSSRRRR